MICRTHTLRDGVSSVVADSGDVVLVSWPHVENLGRLTAPQLEVLRGLAAGQRSDQPAALSTATEAAQLLARLRAGGWIRTDVVTADGAGLFSTTPRWPRARPDRPVRPRRLSRFAAIRREGSDTVLDSPLASCAVTLHDPRLVCTVVDPEGSPAVTSEVAEALLDELADAGLLETATETARLSRAQWSAHELAFHHGSRLRTDHRMGEDFGGTYWARDTFPAPPGRHPAWRSEPVVLARPDLTTLRQTDPSLSAVVEDRRSLRTYDDAAPLTLEQLGHFLFRTARVRSSGEFDGHELSSRPYPSGGAAYELEIYPLVRTVRGLPSALYHYDPHDHVLRRVPASATAQRGLMASSAAGLTGDGVPQVLLLISTRFGRLAWKYQSMAYALTLKHVGVLSQTMYLTATAMGLAACAIGVGDSDAFADATGLDYVEETSVGEFALGSPGRAPQ